MRRLAGKESGGNFGFAVEGPCVAASMIICKSQSDSQIRFFEDEATYLTVTNFEQHHLIHTQ